MNLLLLLLVLPLACAVLLLLLPRDASDRYLRRFALTGSLVTALVGGVVFATFRGTGGAFEMGCSYPWFTLPSFFRDGSDVPVAFALGVDGISILLVALTVIIVPIVILSSAGHITHRVREYLFWILVMEMGMLGVFLSTDVITFYLFWELGLVPLYFVIGIWGGSRRRYATVKFFIYTVAASLPMLLATVFLVRETGTTDLRLLLGTGEESIALIRGLHASGVDGWIFFAFLVAFAVKVPMIPFHTWLPDAHVEAPTGGSVILAGVLLKLGTYGILRFCLGLFPYAAHEFATPLMIVGALGIVYGALLALAQRDMKKLVAYSSVSHLGYVIVGLFALNSPGLRGSLLQMINHGISTPALFLAVGVLYERRHTREISEYGGVAKVMPFFAFVLVFSTMSSIGLPGLNGFVGEFFVLYGSFARNPWIGAVAASGVVLGAIYMLGMVRGVLFGDLRKAENRELVDMDGRERTAFVPLLVLMVWIGVQPQFFLDRVDDSLERVRERVELARRDASEPGADRIALVTPPAETP